MTSLIKDFPHLLHGGDYNPDQWLDRPDILEKDLELMKEAGCQFFSIGIFSWSRLEPEEGRFDFDWLDQIMDNMAAAGNKVGLATATGAMPYWLTVKYPEVVKLWKIGDPHIQSARHNFCMASKVFREKSAILIRKLAERYTGHPALAMWHLSNEYGGHSFSEAAITGFREWLKEKYGSLEALNKAWWCSFWSKLITDWDQIHPMESSIEGLRLDWHRYSTWLFTDFMQHEISCIREFDTEKPVVTNFMGFYPGLDYWRFVPHMSLVADDNYPLLSDSNCLSKNFTYASMSHDLNRTMAKGGPWLLMESSPTTVNWQPTPKLKAPGIHLLEMVKAVAHGADGTLYFQWRKSRGTHEKFHGAVVDHEGSNRTRVFQDVAEVGRTLKKLAPVVGSKTKAEVAILQDWDTRWALKESAGPVAMNGEQGYMDTIHSYYRTLWEMGISVDIPESTADLSHYKLVIAPKLFFLKKGVADSLKTFVENGGILVADALCGTMDHDYLVHEGGLPGGGLRELFGIWAEEVDTLYPETPQSLKFSEGNAFGLEGEFEVLKFAEVLHAEGAEVVATFQRDFYKGSPALTYKEFGKGYAWYLGCDTTEEINRAFLCPIIRMAGVQPNLHENLPRGVTVQKRFSDKGEFIFVLNVSNQPVSVPLLKVSGKGLISGEDVAETLVLKPFGCEVIHRTA